MEHSRFRRALAIVVMLGAALLPSVSPGSGALGASVAEAQGQDPALKIEGRLLAIAQQAPFGAAPVAAQADRLGIASEQGLFRVVIEATGGDRTGARLAVRQYGGRVEAEYEDLIQALVPADRLLAVAADARVRHVRTLREFGPRAIAGQGVQASGAAAWHTANITGAGVKVAVFDSGFTGVDQRKANGDIPQNAQLVDLCNGGVNGSEHGTGVAEIVHEMAPGAEIIMYCVGGEVQLGQAKDQAKAAGVHIISMSLAFFNTSRGDGTGDAATPDGIVADARNSGILWVNSAGNANAGENWNGPWNDPDSDGFLDWVNGDRTNSQQVQPNQRVCGNLKWDAWPTTNQDFALEIRDPNNFNNHLTPPADNPQSGTQQPVESTCYQNTGGAPVTIDWVVRRVNATAPFPPHFELSVFNQTLEHFKTERTIDTPASSPSALAVGALCWQNERLEGYSSRGPTIDGRIKPDIAAHSVVSSGAYGNWQECPANGDGAGGFNGTSAAAPHVAGAAALVKQSSPGFTPAQIQTFLEGRARDAGATGKDNLYGAGILTMGTPGATQPLPPGTPAITTQLTKIAPNQIQVTMTAFTGQTLQSLAWTLPANATAQTTAGAPLPTGITQPAGATSVTFVLVRTGGAAVHLPIVVRGSFGEWRTFVGGGANAW